MKPCSKNGKLIAWLSAGALDARQSRDLRAHLESCEGCRGYFEEISKVTETLMAMETLPEVQASEFFHRRVVAKLKAEESTTRWRNPMAYLRGTLFNWRLVLPAIVATALLIAAMIVNERAPGVSAPEKSRAKIAPAMTHLRTDLPPTIANYQTIANQSLEKLDELLSRQANRNPSATRIYTASQALD
jgi:anti-sigma factor RsiW